MKLLTASTTAAMFLALTGGAFAAEHEVLMLNRDSEGLPMQYEPAFLKIEPGDTVTFIAANPGHNAESILELMPEGAEPFKGAINEEISVTFDIEGVYGIKCQPHLGMGMVGVIQVGEDTSNMETAELPRLPPRSTQRLEDLLAMVNGEAAE